MRLGAPDHCGEFPQWLVRRTVPDFPAGAETWAWFGWLGSRVCARRPREHRHFALFPPVPAMACWLASAHRAPSWARPQ